MSLNAHRAARYVGAALSLSVLTLSIQAGQTAAQEYEDRVSTVFTSDTLPGFGAVGGVTVDALGYVYIADFQNSVWRITPQGEVDKFADGLYGASGNAIGPRGMLYQSSFNANTISRISRTGEVETWVSEGLNGPVGIAIDASGNAFVCNCTSGTIQKVTPEGIVTVFSASELLSCPNGITLDDRGDLYVVNFNNPHVVRITPDGQATSFAQITGAGGNGHITFAQGGFYITQFRGERIFRLNRDGTSSVIAGTGARGVTDGPALQALFSSPNGIGAAPAGNVLWVNDYAGPLNRGPGSYVAMRRIELATLASAMAELPADAETDRVEATYTAFRTARPGIDTRAAAIAQAYQWMSSGRFAHAIQLFQMNADAHPDDASAHFNLGEAFRFTGQSAQAAEQYERTLELSPDHPQAQARLDLVRP